MIFFFNKVQLLAEEKKMNGREERTAAGQPARGLLQWSG